MEIVLGVLDTLAKEFRRALSHWMLLQRMTVPTLIAGTAPIASFRANGYRNVREEYM